MHVSKAAADGKFVLSVINGNSTVGVKIYDAHNNLVHDSSKEVSGDYAQLYSIKNFSGATFEISNGWRDFNLPFLSQKEHIIKKSLHSREGFFIFTHCKRFVILVNYSPVTRTFKFLFLLCIVSVFGCRDSESDSRRWYKGNLHTHSYWSDGDEFPEMIMDWYKSHGYNFVGLSDHNILAEDEKWIKVINSRIYEEGFQKYLAKYDSQWVTHKMDSGRILVKLKTYVEYKPLFEDDKFLIIQSEEISDKFEGKPIHINVTNVKERIEPQGGESVSNVMQRNVDAVLEQRKKTGVPMFPHINHPNFFFAISIQDLIDLRGERFFEVYNGHPMVNNYGDSLRPGTEQMWDMINIAYSNRNQPLMYGLATDDSHNYHQVGSAYSNAGRGWVMVYTDSLKPASLIIRIGKWGFLRVNRRNAHGSDLEE